MTNGQYNFTLYAEYHMYVSRLIIMIKVCFLQKHSTLQKLVADHNTINIFVTIP